MNGTDGFPLGHPGSGTTGTGGDRKGIGGLRGSVPGSVVQVLTAGGAVAGAGFLVGEGVVVTCAHVVRAAGRGPGDRVEVAFPHLPGAPRVWGGVTAGQWRTPEAEDVAVVELESVPAGAGALALGSGAGSRGHRVSSYGFPAQAPPGGHFGYGTAGDLLPDSNGTGALVQLSGANDLTTGFSGGPVVDEVTGLVIGMVTSITSPDAHLKGLGIAYCTPAEVLREVRPDLAEHQVCPYRGLEPFTAEHTGWFHGREAAVESVLEALGGQRRLLLLLGPSGAGKSSLVQAGVLPALADGAVPGSDRWLPLLTRPGQDLLTELEQAGLPGTVTDGLLPAVERRLAGEPDRDRLVLVVDQFEELLAQPAPTPDTGVPDGRLAAAEQLLALIESQADVSVILIMRDDFYPRLAALAPGLLEAAAPAPLNVPATLSVQELRAIITRPVASVGMSMEEGLAERIITDILATDPARRAPVTLLPPLELALSQLWDRRENGRLTHRAYQRIGEVTGSLATWCNTAVGQLSTTHRPTAQRILTALVRPADEAHAIPATRQQATLTHLRALATDPTAPGPAPDSAFEHVLAALTRHRIITTRTVTQPGHTVGEPAAELIHDALIRDWGALRDWVAQDHRFQVWLHRVAEQQKHHAGSGHPGDLLDGTALTEGGDWARERSLPQEIATYYTTSAQHQQNKLRRTRRINTALACMLALALIATGIAFWQRQTALTAQDGAVTAQHEAQSRQLAAQSDFLIGANPDLASLLAVQAHRTNPTNEARASLYAAAALPLRARLASNLFKVSTVAYSPNGKILAVAGPEGLVASESQGAVQLWNVGSDGSAELRSEFTSSAHSVASVTFSPDGRILATGSNEDRAVRLWDVTPDGSPELSATLPSKSKEGVQSVAFSSDGNMLAAAIDGTVHVWKMTPGGPSEPKIAHTDNTSMVNSVAFSPNGEILATGSSSGIDKAVRLWDVTTEGTLELKSTLDGYDESVNSVAFSPDGEFLATGSSDENRGETVRLWDISPGGAREPRNTFTGKAGSVQSVAFSPDGNTLATGSSPGLLRLWDVSSDGTLDLRTTFTGHNDTVRSVMFSPHGETLATGSSDATVRLWDARSGGLSEPRATLTGHTQQLSSVAVSPDGMTFATSSRDKTVRLWDMTSEGLPKLRATFAGPKDQLGLANPVESMAFSPNGTLFVTGSDDGSVRLWDMPPNGPPKPRATLAGPTGPLDWMDPVDSLTFSPNGRLFAAGSDDGSVRLWDMPPNGPPKPRATLAGGGRIDKMLSVAFSPDGRTLATGSGEGAVRLWDVASDGAPKLRHTLTVDSTAMSSVAFSPDGKTLAIAGSDGTVRLWDMTSDGPSASRTTSTDDKRTVVSVAFSPNGRTLATGSANGTVRLWDMSPEGISKPRATLVGEDSAVKTPVVFSPDGKTLAVRNSEKDVNLWNINLPDAAEAHRHICRAVQRNFTDEERSIYLQGQSIDPVCPDAPER
ncbi:trypsin-like peptidase domain-containing protein [Streptomyces anulatus]